MTQLVAERIRTVFTMDADDRLEFGSQLGKDRKYLLHSWFDSFPELLNDTLHVVLTVHTQTG